MHRTCAETGSLLQRSNQFTGALIARLRFARQRAHDNILDRQRQIATEIARRNGRVLETRNQHRHRRIGFERHATGEHLVDHYAERVDVGRRSNVRQPLRLFRRHIFRRSHHRSGDGQPAASTRAARQSKVGQVDPAVAIKHHIGRFDVAVDDAPAVGIVECAGNLFNQPDRLIERQRAAFVDDLLQRAPIDELHRNIVQTLSLVHHIDRNDVGMLESGCTVGFLAKASNVGTVETQLWR
jgi:hypothetical protein